jgi:hypothetical protein
MFAAYLGLTVVFVAAFALVLASASRRLHRVQRAKGGPSARPAPQAAGRAAVPVIRPQSMTGPYAYDDGMLTGLPDEEGES